MTPLDRFNRLEGEGELPDDVRSALSKLTRFEHLEIGELRPPGQAVPSGPAGPAAPAPGAPPPPAGGEDLAGRMRCGHCGQPNERERELCWACFKRLRVAPSSAAPPRGPQDITLVLDGMTYVSSDPNVPEDVRALMDRIRSEGYSQKLLLEWRDWRATRRARQAPEEAERDVEVFQGQRVSVIRLDGKIYKSDDPALSPEMRRLFEYVERNGVTPALLEYLRQFGRKVKFRPSTTAEPTEGDLEFWKDVRSGGPEGAQEAWRRRQSDREVEYARRRFDNARERMLGTGVAILVLAIYIFIRFIF